MLHVHHPETAGTPTVGEHPVNLANPISSKDGSREQNPLLAAHPVGTTHMKVMVPSGGSANFAFSIYSSLTMMIGNR
jgi:hypothetical protein